MAQTKAGWLTLGMVIGLIIGVSLSGILPQTPVHAVATHGQDSFAIATGPVQDEIEALFFLDFLTGDLSAAVLSFQNGRFLSKFTYNVSRDLMPPGAKNPRYLMVTGIADFKRGFGNMQPGRAVVYVAEATSGQVAVYAIPWVPQLQTTGRPQSGPLILLDKKPFRNVVIRKEE